MYPSFIKKITILSYVFILFSCYKQTREYVLHPIDKSTVDLSKSNPMWRFCSDSINVYIIGTDPLFVTDVPAPCLYFFNKFTDQTYIFYELGNFDIDGNNVYLLSDGMTMQHSLYGWFKKNDKNEFCDPNTNEKLVYENNLLYVKNGRVMTVCKVITKIDGFQTPENLNFDFLYKFDPVVKGLACYSAHTQDIFDADEGLYYIPYPGLYVDKILCVDSLAKKVLKERRFIDIAF
jgi:hypothetical protein